MKRSLALVIAGLCIAASVFAGPQAVLSGLKGKVEVKLAQGDWTPATEGMKIDLKTTLSTGFDSTATINIDKSKIVVKPLTRLTLDKLIEQSSGSVAASMFLRVGSVQASVKATTPGKPQDFKVQSPYSTASVRGTEFSFDGLHLAVVEGVVRLVPGRPARDYQDGEGGGGGNEGFEGAFSVGDADPDGGVDVRQNQEANVLIKHSLDTGKPSAEGSGGREGGSGGEGRGQHPGGDAAGGVVITITDSL